MRPWSLKEDTTFTRSLSTVNCSKHWHSLKTIFAVNIQVHIIVYGPILEIVETLLYFTNIWFSNNCVESTVIDVFVQRGG